VNTKESVQPQEESKQVMDVSCKLVGGSVSYFPHKEKMSLSKREVAKKRQMSGFKAN